MTGRLVEDHSMPRPGFGRPQVPGLPRELRERQTAAEEVLWESLRGRRFLGLKFRRQFPVESFIVDFCCYEQRLVVELDGEVHEQPGQAAHDQNRDLYLRSRGYTVLRFSNDSIFEDRTSVLRQIAACLNLPVPVPPSPGGREGDGRGGLGG